MCRESRYIDVLHNFPNSNLAKKVKSQKDKSNFIIQYSPYSLLFKATYNEKYEDIYRYWLNNNIV